MEQKKTRLRRDGNANLIGELEAATALEVLFRQEHLHMAQELLLIFGRKPAKDPNIVRQDRVPSGRDRLST
jgi:hypothetical protein